MLGKHQIDRFLEGNPSTSFLPPRTSCVGEGWEGCNILGKTRHLTSKLKNHLSEFEKSQFMVSAITFNTNQQHGEQKMDIPKILLIAHSTPTLPSQREGRESYSCLNQQSRNLCRETKKFPLLPSGKEGLGENGEECNILEKTQHLVSVLKNYPDSQGMEKQESAISLIKWLGLL